MGFVEKAVKITHIAHQRPMTDVGWGEGMGRSEALRFPHIDLKILCNIFGVYSCWCPGHYPGFQWQASMAGTCTAAAAGPEYRVILFYKYVVIPDTEALSKWQQDLCVRLGLLGRSDTNPPFRKLIVR